MFSSKNLVFIRLCVNLTKKYFRQIRLICLVVKYRYKNVINWFLYRNFALDESPLLRPWKKPSLSHAVPNSDSVRVLPFFSDSVKTGMNSLELSWIGKCLKNRSHFLFLISWICWLRVQDGEAPLHDILNLIQFGDDPQFTLLSMAFKQALAKFDSAANLPFLFLDLYDTLFGQVRSTVFILVNSNKKVNADFRKKLKDF